MTQLRVVEFLSLDGVMQGLGSDEFVESTDAFRRELLAVECAGRRKQELCGRSSPTSS